jgi:hypothetical protein
MELLKELSARHEALKKRIHSFRWVLSPRGLAVARVVYFSTPIVIGYALMQWTVAQREANLGAGNEKLKALQSKARARHAAAER